MPVTGNVTHRTLRASHRRVGATLRNAGMEPASFNLQETFPEHAMGIVIPFPTRPVVDEQIAIRLWELVLAGEVGSAEYRRLDAELNRRRALAPARRANGTRQPRPLV